MGAEDGRDGKSGVTFKPLATKKRFEQLAQTLPPSQKRLLGEQPVSALSSKVRCADPSPRPVHHDRSILSQTRNKDGAMYVNLRARVEVRQNNPRVIWRLEKERKQQLYVEQLKVVADPRVLTTKRAIHEPERITDSTFRWLS